MNKIVFLKAKGKRLSKLYSRHGVINYPMQKLFTSHEESVPHSHEGMQQKAGHCLLTGLLKTPLVNQSRAGKADKDALCYGLIIDIDNVVLPLGSAAPPKPAPPSKTYPKPPSVACPPCFTRAATSARPATALVCACPVPAYTWNFSCKSRSRRAI